MDPSSFCADYTSLLLRYVGPGGLDRGVSADAVAAAEARLGQPLPACLRELYLLAGALRQLQQAHESLLPLTETSPHDTSSVHLRDKHWVFCRENEGGCIWGAEASGVEDPPVRVAWAADDGYEDWAPFQTSLSSFLRALLFHQAAHGGLRYGAVFAASPALVAQVETEVPVVATFGDALEPGVSTPEDYRANDEAVFSVRDDNLWVATRAEAARAALRERLGVSWTLAFPEDFPGYFAERFEV